LVSRLLSGRKAVAGANYRSGRAHVAPSNKVDEGERTAEAICGRAPAYPKDKGRRPCHGPRPDTELTRGKKRLSRKLTFSERRRAWSLRFGFERAVTAPGSRSEIMSTSDSDQLEWLLTCRSRNQQTAFDLLNLMKNKISDIEKDDQLSEIARLLIGSSFSLWRALFLAEPNDRKHINIQHAMEYLRLFIRDNTCDKDSRRLTVHYCMNNALFRLKHLSHKFPDILQDFSDPAEPDLVETFDRLQGQVDLAFVNFSNLLNRQASVPAL
jgi:hypothetical protein